MPLELFVHLALHPVVGRRGVTLDLEPDRAAGDSLRTEVRGHDDDRVLEVHDAALTVGQPTLFEDLQERVEDVGVSLLDLVEQYDRERLAAHLLGELAALFEPDESGRGTEQSRNGVLLTELAHVERDQRALVVEQELGERLGKLGLSDAGRAGEDERARGALRVLQPRALTTDRLRQGCDRLFLTDDALVQRLLHEDEAARLLLGELEHRDAGGLGEHLSDQTLVNDGGRRDLTRTPLLLEAQALGKQALLLVAQGCCLLEVLVLGCRFLLLANLRDLLVELAKLRRARQDAETQARTGLIDQVDGLIGQEPVADVAVGEVCGGDDRAIRDLHLVVRLVPVAQPLEDVDRVGQARLGDLNRLEAALERSILLEVLAVLIQRRGTDGLQLTACEERLQNGCRVNRALCGTGTHEGVDLIDEDDDVAARADLLRDLLEALFEVTAVAGSGDERAEVERIELLVLQRLGDIALDDRLREALDNGGLADAGLTDQHGVVLGATREDLHDPLDLLLAPDHGVELVVACCLREVATELVEHLRAALRGSLGLLAGAGCDTCGLLALVTRKQLDDLLAHLVEVGAELDEHLSGNALTLADEAEQDVLGADVVVAELQGLAQRQLENLLGARRERDVTRRLLLALADDVLHLLAHGIERNPERLERLGSNALTLVDQTQEDVLGADVVVVEHLRLFLGEHNHATGTVGESLEHPLTPSAGESLDADPLLASYIESNDGAGKLCPCSPGAYEGWRALARGSVRSFAAARRDPSPPSANRGNRIPNVFTNLAVDQLAVCSISFFNNNVYRYVRRFEWHPQPALTEFSLVGTPSQCQCSSSPGRSWS